MGQALPPAQNSIKSPPALTAQWGRRFRLPTRAADLADECWLGDCGLNAKNCKVLKLSRRRRGVRGDDGCLRRHQLRNLRAHRIEYGEVEYDRNLREFCRRRDGAEKLVRARLRTLVGLLVMAAWNSGHRVRNTSCEARHRAHHQSDEKHHHQFCGMPLHNFLQSSIQKAVRFPKKRSVKLVVCRSKNSLGLGGSHESVASPCARVTVTFRSGCKLRSIVINCSRRC